MEYIKEVSTQDTGGNCTVDFVHLHDGRVLGITDECVVLYASMQDFWNGYPVERQVIDLLKGQA